MSPLPFFSVKAEVLCTEHLEYGCIEECDLIGTSVRHSNRVGASKQAMVFVCVATTTQPRSSAFLHGMSTRAVVGLLLAVAGMSTTRVSSACERDDAAFRRCAPTARLASPCSVGKPP